MSTKTNAMNFNADIELLMAQREAEVGIVKRRRGAEE